MNPLVSEIKAARTVMAGTGDGIERKVRLCLWSLLYLYMFLECTLALICNWHHPDKRALAFQDINIYIASIFLLTELSFYRENVISVIRILEEDFTGDFEARNYFISSERDSLIDEYNKTVGTLSKFLQIVVYFIIVGHTVPACLTTYYKVTTLGVVETTDFDLPAEFSYTTINFVMKPNILTYVCIYILQAICFANAKYVATLIYLSVAGPAEKLKLEMKLLSASVHAFEEYFKSQTRDQENYLAIEDRRLKCHLKFLVKYHNFIIRQTKNMNISVRFSALEMVQGICMEFSMYLYGVAQVNTENIQKLNQICVISLVITYFYGYSTIGEEFIKEGEMLYARLYETCWYEKPAWIKRTFLLIMSQATHPLEIKPMGLFVIGVKSFTNVLNTAYSAFNVFRSTQT